MKSQPRWREFYENEHPMALPKAVHQQLKDSARFGMGHTPIRYLWVVLSKEGLELGSSASEAMDRDQWLNLVDEAAGMGVASLIVSVGEELAQRPEIWDLCRWAQETHDMLVGLHLTASVPAESLSELGSLTANTTFVFVHSSRIEQYRSIEEHFGVRVFASDGLQDGVEQRHCTLPSQMACVGGDGNLYTCGLVVEQDDYKLGDARGDRVDRKLADTALPHEVPAGTSTESHRCDGCPPLMEERMRRESGRQ